MFDLIVGGDGRNVYGCDLIVDITTTGAGINGTKPGVNKILKLAEYYIKKL